VSLTVTVIGKLPLTVGVPLINPVLVLSDSPPGSEPLVSAHVNCPIAPVTVIGNEYGDPCAPTVAGHGAVIVSTEGAITILHEYMATC
jgi:hypothetical protein